MKYLTISFLVTAMLAFILGWLFPSRVVILCVTAIMGGHSSAWLIYDSIYDPYDTKQTFVWRTTQMTVGVLMIYITFKLLFLLGGM